MFCVDRGVRRARIPESRMTKPQSIDLLQHDPRVIDGAGVRRGFPGAELGEGVTIT